MNTEIDTTNKFLVASGDRGIVIMFPPAPLQILTKAEALTFAAWIVVIADLPPGLSFNDYLNAVMAT